jgi:hypothetical protein
LYIFFKKLFFAASLRKEEEISRAKISCRILAKNKANFEFNAARCTKNLTQFLGKRQAKLALLITDAFLSSQSI